MQVTLSKTLALLVAGGIAVAIVAPARSLTPHTLEGLLLLFIPLALIWFPEEIGEFTGYVGRGGDINAPSPAFLVAALGWFFLIGLPVLLYLIGK